MITGAGGALEHLIRQGGTEEALNPFFEAAPLLGFFIPFLIAAVLTSATGSITVSLIGTASIVRADGRQYALFTGDHASANRLWYFLCVPRQLQFLLAAEPFA
jgi:H+/gluconate symporter-like permease